MSKRVIADIDGTVLLRWERGRHDPVPNPAWGHRHAAALVTNQGGVPLRWCGFGWARQKYPTLRQILARVRAAQRISGARVALVILYHPKQEQAFLGWLLARMGRLLPPIPIGGGIYLSFDPRHRKPAPGGLLWAARRIGASKAVYVGDEPSDREAALAAGMDFEDIAEA